MCTLTVLFLSLGDIPVICKVFIPSIVLSEISILLVSPAFILSVLIFLLFTKSSKCAISSEGSTYITP